MYTQKKKKSQNISMSLGSPYLYVGFFTNKLSLNITNFPAQFKI